MEKKICKDAACREIAGKGQNEKKQMGKEWDGKSKIHCNRSAAVHGAFDFLQLWEKSGRGRDTGGAAGDRGRLQ